MRGALRALSPSQLRPLQWDRIGWVEPLIQLCAISSFVLTLGSVSPFQFADFDCILVSDTFPNEWKFQCVFLVKESFERQSKKFATKTSKRVVHLFGTLRSLESIWVQFDRYCDADSFGILCLRSAFEQVPKTPVRISVVSKLYCYCLAHPFPLPFPLPLPLQIELANERRDWYWECHPIDLKNVRFSYRNTQTHYNYDQFGIEPAARQCQAHLHLAQAIRSIH